ncbi:ubiquitin carboxyl-terminal hydrolase 48-like isoform X2 [Ptychodera flava]|uniref:ubiquitin carboxyl-terminal hydrolase 48-like isoform X2 n=1 Tax=Ptychodera flava TaxID=63121 RepID=UPI003969E7D8
MPPKYQQNKAAWKWIETTTPEEVTLEYMEIAYKVKLKPCKPGSCRRNCKGNPNCLMGLGESLWLGEIDDDSWHEIEDPNTERRVDGSFVGLKNLGATCYVNTLLQVWFHNEEFRKTMYKWTPLDRDRSKAKSPCKTQAISLHKSDLALKNPPDVPAALRTQNSVSLSEEQMVVDRTDENSTKEGGVCEPRLAGSGDVPTSQGNIPSSSPQKSVPKMSLEDEDLAPSTVCGHLQLLFALLEHSKRRYIDPSAFIDCLGLDAALQQDAQEFSKLLMSLLEEMLQEQPNVCVRNVIQQQFSGEYAYVTKCNNCGGISQRQSKFYELDLNIQGHKQLSECLQEFLQEEKLEGANQYLCERCNSKQNASRRIQLHKLPTVLNLQLLRFIFDRQTGHKKKLNTYIQFPEVLDITPYLVNKDVEVLYDLTAVLIHRGPSAYSGHYIAHIKDKDSGTWYKFNDEEIEKMGGKNLKLGSEEDIEDGGPKPPKKPKLLKGFHASRNAYMLVYNIRQPEQVPNGNIPAMDEDVQISGELRQLVVRDNEIFEDWVKEMTQMREINVLSGKARHNEIRHLYSQLMPREGDYVNAEWLTVDWLKKWLADSNTVCPKVDNARLLCIHGSLDPDKVNDAKLVSLQAADIIFTNYGGEPRIRGDSLCKRCVVERCRLLRTKMRVAEDYKAINNLTKNKIESGFWIGKCSFRSWRRLVLSKLENNNAENSNANGSMEDKDTEDIPKTTESKPSQDSGKGSVDEESIDEDWDFNEDILCPHGYLSTDDSCRRLVSEEVWHRLRHYFPDSPEFSSNIQPCSSCEMTDKADEESSELNKRIALEQKAALSQLYHDRNRPTWVKKDVNHLYVVTSYFLEAWRKFIKQPLRNPQVTQINNELLLCSHRKLLFHPDLLDDKSMDMVSYVWPQEWNALRLLFAYDCAIEITRVTEDDGKTKTFRCTPEICEECISQRISKEEKERKEYTDETIYIRKLTDTEKPNFALLEGLDDAADISDGSIRDDADPDFTQDSKGKKTGINQDKQIRRSSRHRRTRGEKQITVSASNTLKELKLKVMHVFSVAPFDQHLMFESGRHILDDTATLGDLGVTPGEVLYLKVDLPCEDPLLMDDIIKACAPEEGFKGTGLLRS